MLFNSWQFLVFFPLVCTAYFLTRAQWRWLILLISSYIFYMAWEPIYALLIIYSTVVDYFVARAIAAARERRRKLSWLLVSLCGNLGLLFFFKYYGFFAASVEPLIKLAGIPLHLQVPELLLPVGISFYTFQTLGYSIDIYRGDHPPERHFGIYALYVAFFPQLVAGPIERSGSLLPQLARAHDFDYERVVDGLVQMTWGMFKKVVIADRLAIAVNAVYAQPAEASGPALTLATIFFAFQIYCDFSGYSDIAIGAARVLGVDLRINFNRPYSAASLTEFWHRWHISLSTWFRDYVFFPLGGSRVSTARVLYNLLLVFLLSGLWHGANWTFVIWGAIHGVLIMAERLLSPASAHFLRQLIPGVMPERLRPLKVFTTFVIVCLAWIFFRAQSLDDALVVLAGIPQGWPQLLEGGGRRLLLQQLSMSAPMLLFSVLLIGFLHFSEKYSDVRSLRQTLIMHPGLLRWGAYYALVTVIVTQGVFNGSEFIYFQF